MTALGETACIGIVSGVASGLKAVMLCVAAVVFVASAACAQDSTTIEQDSTKPFITVDGSATLTADVYDFAATPDAAEPARRPPSLARLLLNPTITIGGRISLPFSIMLSSRETNVTTPVTNNPTFTQFVQNPANALGILSFSPRIDWVQLFLGTHTPEYSELSYGDEQLFGVGMDLRPGNFRLAASYGTSQRAIEPDNAKNIRGAYARRALMMKVGYGSEESSLIALNAIRVEDDSTSIAQAPAGVTPQAGVLLSANFRIGISDNTYVTGEAGASAFTRDVTTQTIETSTPIPSSVLEQHAATRADYAGHVAFVTRQSWWGLRATARYIGPGYVPLGYPFMQADRMEFQVAPSVQLFESALHVSGSIGTRTNNLSGTKGTATTQLTGSVDVLATVTDALSVMARFANFGVRNNISNDTFKLETVARAFEIAPTYTIAADAGTHTITVSYALDAFTDYNLVTGREGSNNTQNIMAMYALSLVEMPLTANATVGHLTNDLAALKLGITSASLGVGYALFDGRVTPLLTASHTRTTQGGSEVDIGTLLRIAVQWRATDRITLSTAFSTNGYSYDASRPGVSYRENFLETSLSTQF